MNIFVDLDNTLCETTDSDYSNSKPINERIDKVNKLKDCGNKITIWTARGQISGIDYTELTKKQLTEWDIRYDKLLMGKPSYDLYIDDKSFNVNKYWKIPTKNLKSKKIESKIVKKGWGKEIWFVNNDEYCGKILCFDNGTPTDAGSKRLANSMKKNNIEITLDLNSGKAMQTIYFSDLSHEYVHINSAYTT